jgi:hypothetical protein
MTRLAVEHAKTNSESAATARIGLRQQRGTAIRTHRQAMPREF